jgi:multimeric flavodoxin WrbA
MNQKPLIIVGSSRRDSDTKKFVELVFKEVDNTTIDLLDFTIHQYDYDNGYPGNDCFLEVVNLMLEYKVIVFATPVYWYSMSGLMKTFFDRFSDLVTVRKQLGRQLKGKITFLIAVGAEKDLPVGFETPFESTSEYMDMIYNGSIYYCTHSKMTEYDPKEMIRNFKEKMGLPGLT